MRVQLLRSSNRSTDAFIGVVQVTSVGPHGLSGPLKIPQMPYSKRVLNVKKLIIFILMRGVADSSPPEVHLSKFIFRYYNLKVVLYLLMY